MSQLVILLRGLMADMNDLVQILFRRDGRTVFTVSGFSDSNSRSLQIVSQGKTMNIFPAMRDEPFLSDIQENSYLRMGLLKG
jgi:uncharacterized protein YkuJ